MVILLSLILAAVALPRLATAVEYPFGQCAHLKAPKVPGAEIISIVGIEKRNFTVPVIPQLLPTPIYGLDICEVDIYLTHPGANDKVLVTVWLPLEKWNGRFQATGGSGYAAGTFEATLGPAAKLGYSAASTDAGVGNNALDPGAWALGPNKTVNRDALANFGYRSVHDMGIVGKEITAQFYGKKPRYSYWNGCSTGGRQAMVAAQRYPTIFDGIVAGAPAINWAAYVVAEQWPQVVMAEESTYPSKCELQLFTATAIKQCDGLDGVRDGVITNPDICHFDPYQLVGTHVVCDGETIKISKSTARVVEKILQGPFSPSGKPLWYGLNIGAPLDSLASTTVVDGKRVGDPLFVNKAWITYWLAQNPSYNLNDMNYAEFESFFSQSTSEYDEIIGTDNPDLSAFNHGGGKLIMWHGLADQLIFPGGTIDYRKRVERLMGGSSKVDDFFRLFLAPGVDHCAGGTTVGAAPSDVLGTLVSWVEENKIPDTLAAEIVDPATSTKQNRIICHYPLIAEYKGGDARRAESFACV